jgi:hypothetical protein
MKDFVDSKFLCGRIGGLMTLILLVISSGSTCAPDVVAAPADKQLHVAASHGAVHGVMCIQAAFYRDRCNAWQQGPAWLSHSYLSDSRINAPHLAIFWALCFLRTNSGRALPNGVNPIVSHRISDKAQYTRKR